MKPLLRAAANPVAGRRGTGRRPAVEGSGCRKSCTAASRRLRFAVVGLTAASIIRPVAATKPWTLTRGQSGTVRSICLHSLVTRESRPRFRSPASSRAIAAEMQLTVKFGSACEWVPIAPAEPFIGFGRDGGVLGRPACAFGASPCNPLQARPYDRPRNATTITPAIASRPPHAVAMPGRSPVSATDSSVATAGVR